MKNLLIPAAAVIGLGLALASPAFADEAGFFSALEAGGIVANDGALAMGQAVCNEINEGIPEGTTVVAIYRY